jgi:hypothetical protein
MTATATRESDKDRRVREQHGLTNDPIWIERVRAFVAAAVADGWRREQYFQSEPLERACKLYRDGFTLSVLMRDGQTGNYRFQTDIHGWGPDGLSINLPNEYDWHAIQALVTTCNLCNAKDVKTFRYSFAGRCCESCVPKARAQFEKPGWDR